MGLLSKVVPWQQLGRKVFGETIPEAVQPVLKELSPEDAFTFGKAIEFDSTVREPLDTLLHSAASGSDDAYMLMEYAARDFAKENATYKNLDAASKKLAKQQRKNWHTLDDRIEAAPTAAGEPGRRYTANVASLSRNPTAVDTGLPMQAATKQADPADYRGSSVYSGGQAAPRAAGQAITEVHHGGPLDKLMRLVYSHSSFQGVTPDSPSPLIEMGERLFGAQIGNSPQNTVDILGWMTKRGRNARVLALSEQVGDVMHSKTIDDLLGTSDYRPPEIPQEGLDELGQLRDVLPDLSVEQYMDTGRNPVTGKAYPKGGVGTKIEIWDPKANISKNSPDKPLEVIKLTEATYPNRVQLAFDAYQKHGIDVTEARKKWDKKLAKVDPKEDILGMDHDHVHDILREVEKIKGTALYELSQMTDDEIFNLPMEKAFELYIRQMQEAETVLANVLQYRYGMIEKIFVDMKKKGQLSGYVADKFDELGAEAKQRFFRQNVNTIAVKGNVMKDISIKKAMKPVKNWNNHIGDTFGWSPQSLWVTIQEIEELAKEFAAKVPTEQPIPGVV